MWNSCRSDGVWLQLSYTVVEPEDGGAVQERPTASTAAEAAHQEWHGLNSSTRKQPVALTAMGEAEAQDQHRAEAK